MRSIVINGAFLAEPVTGVQRYARETLNCLDKYLADVPVKLAVPGDLPKENIPHYENIPAVALGPVKKSIRWWEQTELGRYLKSEDTFGVHLCNTFPLSWARGLIVIHDIFYKTREPLFAPGPDKKEVIFRRLLYKKAFEQADELATVSFYSRREIFNCYSPKNPNITVAGNGWDHFKRIKSDESIFEKDPRIVPGNYFLYCGSLAKNKNIPWVVHNAQLHPELNYVICGGNFGETQLGQGLPNVILTGRVSDGQMKALMSHCRAFLFPSTYEGFGIPPMEALSCGARIIVSDIPLMHEVYGPTALFVDPASPNYDIAQMLQTRTAPASDVLRRYSWEKTARRISEPIHRLSDRLKREQSL
jgi:glycosyltransferase involved in cell wall biosynthesis